MKLRTCLLTASVALVLTSAASAQSLGPAPNPAPNPAPGPAPRHAYGALPPQRIAMIVRGLGFDPLFRPMRQGDTYVLRALDRNDLEYRLVIDAYTGRTISVRATGARGGPARYGPYGGPVYGRIFGPADEPYDRRYRDGGPLPPRDMPRRRPLPPQTAKVTPSAPPAEARKSPAPQSTQAPMPRPRPYVMEATSSVPADAPKPAEPAKASPAPAPVPAAPPASAPAAPAAPPADTPQNNGGPSMPPVAPLD